jgi:hypothetical protein
VSRSARGRYTVVGIWNGNDPIVAGVISGWRPSVDRDDGAPREFNGRWSVFLTAHDPDEAEARAVEEMQATRGAAAEEEEYDHSRAKEDRRNAYLNEWAGGVSYEGYVKFADDSVLSLQCHEDRHDECDGGLDDGYVCECHCHPEED